LAAINLVVKINFVMLFPKRKNKKISKIENDELKDKYLKKLNKTMKNDFDKPVKTKIYLDETLERFSKQKSLV